MQLQETDVNEVRSEELSVAAKYCPNSKKLTLGIGRQNSDHSTFVMTHLSPYTNAILGLIKSEVSLFCSVELQIPSCRWSSWVESLADVAIQFEINL